jgi:UDP-N-acetylglucosamine acyltransferase
MPVEIHPTAIVEKGAELGPGVSIGPHSIIGPRVRIGNGCRIGSSVLIEGDTILGDDNAVWHGAVIGTTPQDLKYRGERTSVRIGSRNTIREYATIHLSTSEESATTVGDDNLLMAYVHLAHDCVIGSRTILANVVQLAGHVAVQDFAIIGGVVPVHQFARIGQHAIVGGGSRVAQDVPPFVMAAGNPPRVSGINVVGLKRRGFGAEQRALLKKAFVILYRSGLNVSQAIQRMEEELPRTPEIVIFIDFVKSSHRGIIR